MKITINFTKKKLLKITLILISICLLIVFYFYKQKYTISNLSPNLIQSLKRNEIKNIFFSEVKTTSFIENSNFMGCNCNEKLFISNEHPIFHVQDILKNDLKSVECCEFNFIYIENVPNPYYQVWDYTKKIYFDIYLNKKKYPYSFRIMQFNIEPEKSQKAITDYYNILLNSHEYILIKSEFDNGHKLDYLIKDVGDNFLIYTIAYYNFKPEEIWCDFYKKQKYFNNLFD